MRTGRPAGIKHLYPRAPRDQFRGYGQTGDPGAYDRPDRHAGHTRWK